MRTERTAGHGRAAPRRRRAALAVAALSIVAACSDDDSSDGASKIVSQSASAPTTTTPADDGVLLLGVLLPMTGPGTEIGTSMTDAVDLAVRQVNGAGGVNGEMVRVVKRDEGGDSTSAARSLDELLRAGVDAVIGPSSSLVALSTIGTTTSHHVVACSPTATALALDDFPDDGYFIRTSPSDSLQAVAIAQTIEETGRSSASVLYLDDGYGAPFAAALTTALEARSIRVVASVPYAATGKEFSDSITEANAVNAEVVAVIGDSDAGARLTTALLEATEAEQTPLVVSDAIRRPTSANAFTSLSEADRERLLGVSPSANGGDPWFMELLAERDPDGTQLYAANAFDCVNLIALGAAEANSNTATSIAGAIIGVSRGGSRCVSFGDCAELLDADRNIDYDGAAGELELGGNGDLSRAQFDRFGFTAEGRDETRSMFVVSAD